MLLFCQLPFKSTQPKLRPNTSAAEGPAAAKKKPRVSKSLLWFHCLLLDSAQSALAFVCKALFSLRIIFSGGRKHIHKGPKPETFTEVTELT